jgi:sulfide:quinone oxidoreductase
MTTSVLVLGAGFGGLELSSRLSDELGDQVDITLIDRADSFVFGFSKLDVMFGKRTPEAVRLRYDEYAMPRVRFLRETITAIEPANRRVVTDGGAHEADVLVVALGAEYDVAATPGLAEAGNEFYSVSGAEIVRDILPGFTAGSAIVGICGTPFKCPPAPSEAALLLDEYLRERGLRDAVRIQVVMPFGRPVPPSPETSDAILARFAERGIEFIPDRMVVALDSDTREALLSDGSFLPFDLFLGVPVHRVPDVVSASGMTQNGWIPVDPGSGATRFPGVYALGDVTSVGTPKAGVFAERAARALADQLIARARGEAEPPGYDGTGTCWIEFGNHEVAGVSVDFFSTPGHPTGTFTEPSPRTAVEKAAFGTERHARWFGLGASER